MIISLTCCNANNFNRTISKDSTQAQYIAMQINFDAFKVFIFSEPEILRTYNGLQLLSLKNWRLLFFFFYL